MVVQMLVAHQCCMSVLHQIWGVGIYIYFLLELQFSSWPFGKSRLFIFLFFLLYFNFFFSLFFTQNLFQMQLCLMHLLWIYVLPHFHMGWVPLNFLFLIFFFPFLLDFYDSCFLPLFLIYCQLCLFKFINLPLFFFVWLFPFVPAGVNICLFYYCTQANY